MDFEFSLLFIVAIFFIGGLLRSVFGFADALVAMPLLSILLGIEVARPLVALYSVTIAAAILAREWREIHIGSAWRLILSSAAGIPIALAVLHFVDERSMKIVLAILVIGFALYSLLKPKMPKLKNDRYAFFFGAAAGMLGFAYNTSGPPVVVYGVLRRWTPEQFRATFQSYTLPLGLMILSAHAASGLWTKQVFKYYLVALPFMALALVLGRVISKRIQPQVFIRYVYMLLIAIGVLLLVNSTSDLFVGD